MKRRSVPIAAVLYAAVLFTLTSRLFAQSSPTASRTFEPSAFLGLTGTYTGLEQSRNLSVTAGLDLGFHPYFGFLPSIEVRGTHPLANGQVAGEESVLAGLRLGKRYTHVRPYADVLLGRGALNYQNGGFVVPAQDFRYIQSTSNIFSVGVGAELDVDEHFALLLDGQFQHWNLPFTPNSDSTASSHIYSKVGTVAAVYRFNWLVHGHPGR